MNRKSDLWPYLSEHLILESPTVAADTASYQLRFTTTTTQRQAYKSDGSGVSKVRPEQVLGALSTLEALSCAYELLETIRLMPLSISQHSLMLVNSSTDLLSKSEHKSHLDSSSKLYFSLSERPYALISSVELLFLWACLLLLPLDEDDPF